MTRFVRNEWEKENAMRSDINGMRKDMVEKINIAQTGADSLVEILHETCFETMEERMDNRMDALEERINATRKEMQLKPNYQDICHRIREHLGKPNTALTIEQKKHICSAIDKWWEPVRSIDIYGDFESTKDVFLEQLKVLICDTKVGEFIHD